MSEMGSTVLENGKWRWIGTKSPQFAQTQFYYRYTIQSLGLFATNYWNVYSD
jgi:hypothetical protein